MPGKRHFLAEQCLAEPPGETLADAVGSDETQRSRSGYGPGANLAVERNPVKRIEGRVMAKRLLLLLLCVAWLGSGQALPDLIVERVDASQVNTDSQTLVTSGQVTVRVKNIGGGTAAGSVRIIAFEDRNRNDVYDQAADLLLGQVAASISLAAGTQSDHVITVSGPLLFKGNRIHALVDANNSIAEQSEGNNVGNSGGNSQTGPVVGPFTPTLKWSWTSSNRQPNSIDVGTNPLILDVNGDEVPDVVFASNGGATLNGILRALDGRTGAEIFTVDQTQPIDLRVNFWVTPAGGDIDGDGKPEIITADLSTFRLIAFEHDGTFKWRSQPIEQAFYGAISIADLDGDGTPEIIHGRQVLRNDGTFLWTGTGGQGQHFLNGMISIVADVDLDGSQDVIAGNTVYSASGTIKYRNTALGDGFNAVGNFDSDPEAEIVLVSGGLVYILEHDLTVKAGPISIPGVVRGGPPTVADFDGDGQPEIGVAGVSQYIVLETDGQLKWQRPVRDSTSGVMGSSVFDFEGDGVAEVIYRDEVRLWVFRGSDGAVLFEAPMSAGGVAEYPLVADVDSDGKADIIVTANTIGGFGPYRGVFVYSNPSWVSTRKIWNQHAYSITNVNDDGTIPRYPQPNWLTPGLNNFRLNTFSEPERVLGAPDFVPSFLRSDASSFPSSASLTARVGNGGSGTSSSRSGKFVVGPDVNTLSSSLAGAQEAQFAVNVANWLTEGKARKKVLLIECSAGWERCDYAPIVRQALETAGFSTTVSANYTWTEAQLAAYDAIFIAQQVTTRAIPTSAALLSFIRNGGGIYIVGGVQSLNQGVSERDAWKSVTDPLGFEFNAFYTFQNVTAALPHPVTSGVSQVQTSAGQGFRLLGTNPTIQVLASPGGVNMLGVGNASVPLEGSPLNVSFYLGDPATGGTLLGTTQTTKALAPGEFEDVSITWNNPPAGLHPIVVVVDPDNAIAEGDETNNKAAALIRVGPAAQTLVDSVISRFKDRSADVIWARVNGAVGYNVYRRTAGGAPVRVRSGLTGTSFTDTGLTNGTPYFYTVRWVDAQGVESPDGTEASATPTPTGSTGNTPPSILSYPVTRGRTATPYAYQLRAGDPDAGEVLSYSLTAPPEGMTVSSTGRITWTPGLAQAGLHRVQVQVTDKTGRFASQSFLLFIEAVVVNNPPAFTSTPISSAATGQSYAYAAKAVDPDAGDFLSFSLTTAPAGMTINGAGVLSWTPQIAQVGSHPVTVRVQDLGGLFDTQSFTVTVTRNNRPPQILSSAPATGRVGSAYGYAVRATDPDLAAGDVLSHALTAAPTGMTINPTTGLIAWIPGAGQQGEQTATVRVTDSDGLFAAQTFTVNVLPPNQAPVITSQAPTKATVNGGYSYVATATDPDEDPLTWTVVSGPTGLSVGPSTGVVQWTPTAQQEGAHPVTIRVEDALGLGASQSFTITVGPADTTDPTVSIVTPASGTSLATDVEVIGSVSDDNLQEWTISYRVPGDPNWIRFGSGTANVSNGLLGSFRASLLANNPYRILLQARDAAGNSNSQEIEVLVDAGDLKLGDFTISFSDMTIPGLGLPVAIQRTYDTKQPQQGDFGPGWSLSFSGIYLRRDVNFNVFVTLPSGRRVKFNYTPIGNPFFNVFTTKWTAEGGTYDTLENLDCPQVLGPPPTPLCGGFQAWNPQNWILRTKEGFTYTITSSGGVRRMEDRSGNWMEITPDGVTTNTGQDIPFVRDGQGRIVEIREPAPATGKLRYEYDEQGRLARFLDQTGATTTYKYENASFPVYLTGIDDPLGRPALRNIFDEAGRLVAQCDANGNPATLAGCARFEPNANARQQTIYNSRGFKTELLLDARGNILNERRFTSATQFLETVRSYDANNNVLTERDPAGNLKTFTYDTRGNLLTETDPGGRRTTYTYNACDKVATETDPAGQTTTYTYDSACRLTEVRNALNHVTRYEYNSRGQRTKFVDTNNQEWTWAYNSAGFLTSLTDPFGKASSFSFSPTGNLLSRTDRLGRRIDFQYDSANRMTRETWDTGRVTTYSYDSAGQLLTATDPDSALTMTYDTNGRLRTVDNQGTPGAPRVVMTYSYDANGNVTQVADSLGGVTSYSYDGLDRLARVTQSGTGVQPKRVDMEYDPASLLTAMRRFANLAGTQAVANTFYEYDCGGCPGRLTAIRHRKAADDAVIHDLTYTRDVVGNITQMVDADGTHNYTYDAIRRLLTATHSNPSLQPNEFYNLDPAGNRLTSHLSNVHLYNGNRLMEDQQHTYLYDDEGNQVRKTVKATGAYTEYVYDHRNRMTAVVERTAGGVETARYTYTFDAINRRITANEAGQLAFWGYDGLNPALKMGTGGTMISRRMYSRNLDQVVADQDATQTRWFLVDQVGSTRDLVSNGSTLLNRLVFDAFGKIYNELTPQVVNDLTFTGREFTRDGEARGFFRARVYVPSQGRFTRRDPLMPYAYDYVSNQPLAMNDPRGESPTTFGLSAGASSALGGLLVLSAALSGSACLYHQILLEKGQPIPDWVRWACPYVTRTFSETMHRVRSPFDKLNRTLSGSNSGQSPWCTPGSDACPF